ncbi:Capsular polysaccharide synthesis protein [Schinkia azotoformans MEV2011]|uniref:Capsular polysaccharide synthesis protein n=1 Tax=Schinkia azotoformans MEV2011 TaxID=1348973 RepID=A0A072P2Q4_SCHAZ|nr:glycosyltransferase [Schinkia azotoformans]KEF39760.1 Capsular polysaccharide synthesis protein [Schinkia azotoformans MEV2011]MEC1695021.1 glycosyltransferase [Schinkia azotoformans]MEC1716370.1 glycosyltransferase [Schinkia azotoformans]MEC1726827.1 glycosyltransferase [Schinkia azotoformans]MEC1740007.1 glycosyltransferase [Schinkia azotoformans]
MAKVPNIFHFVFGLRPQKEPFHFAYYMCLLSCLIVNQPEKIYFHYKHLPYGKWWDRIRPHLSLNKIEEDSFISSYQYKNKELEKYRYAHLSDITRLEILLEYGGVYADIDTLFVNKLPTEFFDKSFIMGKEKVNWNEKSAEKAGGSLCNAWILSEKNSSFTRRWLDRIYEAFDGTWSNHSTFLPYYLSQQHPNEIHVEPERSFFHFDWSKQGITNIFLKQQKDLSQIYSIHLWSHLWWEKDRIDNTYFHNERLTPNYVAFAETTYADIARPFLPADIQIDKTKFYLETIKWSIENKRLLAENLGKRFIRKV